MISIRVNCIINRADIKDINSFTSKVDKLKVNGERKLYKGKQRSKYTTPEGSNVAVSGLFELFWKNSSYVSGVSVCIFVALYVGMFVARANKVEGTMSWCLGTNEILASI